MNVGMVGLGKLGLPIAQTMEFKHFVLGYDVNPLVGLTLKHRVNTLKYLVDNSQIIFVAVQTPHEPRFEGILPYKGEGEDFNYEYLKEAVRSIIDCIESNTTSKTLAIISTVLPGTVRREILPIVGRKMKVCYNPYFIAMGTEAKDFLSPEFVLIGRDTPIDAGDLETFYAAFHGWGKTETMTIESAELTKVAYNCYISQKIALANAIMEISHKVPRCDARSVSGALKKATDRIVSSKYMDGGMGDSGGCHPRDGIAMSWLARELKLSFDPFAAAMEARTKQTEWLADLIQEEYERTRLPVILLGKAYKPESDLTIGSCAILLGNILTERRIPFQHYEKYHECINKGEVAIYFLATKHHEFSSILFPIGSVVIDPFRYLGYQGDDVKVISVGVP